MKKIQTLAILACAASLFAQEPAQQAATQTATPAATTATVATAEATPAATTAAAAQETSIACKTSFESVKNTYPRDASADRIYAMVNARIFALESLDKDKRSGAVYEAELKACDLSVEILKLQLSNVALRASLDSLTQKNSDAQKNVSATKDAIISSLEKETQGTKETAEKEKANLSKQLAEKDSLLAKQKAEADKKLEALRSKTISVYKDARGTILSMSDILFESGKATLTQELQVNLAEVAAILKTLLTESAVTVEGHTDNTGTVAFNKKLSEERAAAVLNYLVERGVDKKRLKSVGYGPNKPIADNKDADGRAKNRRVELVIKDI